MTRRFRHITGARGVATVAAGAGLAALGLRLVAQSFDGAKGPVFLGVAGGVLILMGLGIATLPYRIVTTATKKGVGVGWMFGRRFIPWEDVRWVVLGPLGTGKERDPTALTILLTSGEEVLFSSLGRKSAQDHAAAQAFMEYARECGVKVHDVMAPKDEREDRERQWRELRTKGHR